MRILVKWSRESERSKQRRTSSRMMRIETARGNSTSRNRRLTTPRSTRNAFAMTLHAHVSDSESTTQLTVGYAARFSETIGRCCGQVADVEFESNATPTSDTQATRVVINSNSQPVWSKNRADLHRRPGRIMPAGTSRSAACRPVNSRREPRSALWISMSDGEVQQLSGWGRNGPES